MGRPTTHCFVEGFALVPICAQVRNTCSWHEAWEICANESPARLASKTNYLLSKRVYLTQGLARVCWKVSCLYCLASIFSRSRQGKVWIISNYIKYKQWKKFLYKRNLYVSIKVTSNRCGCPPEKKFARAFFKRKSPQNIYINWKVMKCRILLNYILFCRLLSQDAKSRYRQSDWLKFRPINRVSKAIVKAK